MNTRWRLIGLLVLLGAGWGATMPLGKIAVSTGYRSPGLVFWQFAIGAVVLYALTRARGKNLPFGRRELGLYTLIALIGTLLPNSASYEALRHLPSGLASILISTIPLLAFPIALAFRQDQFSLLRLLGLVCGIAGVALIVGPEASLPDRAMLIWVPLALIAPAFYAFEGNYIGKFGTRGLDPIQLLCGASIVGIVLVTPITLLTGSFISPLPPYGAADIALMASVLIHALVYSSYFWMVGRAGPVFAAQVSYLVTLFGVFWAKLVLGESYSVYIWAALGLMMVGIFLVQPRQTNAVKPA